MSLSTRRHVRWQHLLHGNSAPYYETKYTYTLRRSTICSLFEFQGHQNDRIAIETAYISFLRPFIRDQGSSLTYIQTLTDICQSQNIQYNHAIRRTCQYSCVLGSWVCPNAIATHPHSEEPT